jgi:hypothetical protein
MLLLLLLQLWSFVLRLLAIRLLLLLAAVLGLWQGISGQPLILITSSCSLLLSSLLFLLFLLLLLLVILICPRCLPIHFLLVLLPTLLPI